MQGQEEDSGLTSGLPFESVDGRAGVIRILPRSAERGKGKVQTCHLRVRL